MADSQPTDSNPYAPPSQAASAPVVDHSARGVALRKRASWLRALGGSIVLRAIVINLAYLLTVLVLRMWLGQRIRSADWAVSRLFDLPVTALTVVAMWKTTARFADVPLGLASRRLRHPARWFTIGWALAALSFRVTDLAGGIRVLMHLERGMFTLVMAFATAYAASLASGKWLKRFAYASTLITLASLPWRYLLNAHFFAYISTLSQTVIVTLLVAREQD